MKRSTYNSRRIWEKHHGPIPIDGEGFSYEIHHIDRNPNNDSIENLSCVTIREHLKIHLDSEEWFAAALIAKRLGLGAEYMSSIQTGQKRPGVGGRKKGSIPWNRGKTHSDETKKLFSQQRKGKRFGRLKLTDEICLAIIKDFENNVHIDGVGERRQNGRNMSYIQAFSKVYGDRYNVTSQAIKCILTGKRRVLQK